MKKPLNIIKWTLIIAYLLFITYFISSKSKTLVCTEVNVTVTDSLTNRFVTSDEIKMSVLNVYPKLYGSLIKDLDFEGIEAIVKKNPAIQSCRIHSNAKGIVNIEVQQYKPIIRVFSGSASFYFDEAGNKIPISNKFNVSTLVVNGTIPIKPDELLYLAKFIKNDPFWDAQIEQIYIRRDNVYLLAPRVGEHIILLGPPVDIEQKFKNLKAFYQQLDPKLWNEYKIINLKFKNQVVCSRNPL